MNIVHLTDSPFFGGPERQILGLALSLPASFRTTVLCFNEVPACAPFIEQLQTAGVAARMLSERDPHFIRIVSEIRRELRTLQADLLVVHGYKADALGLIAARKERVPVMSVSRGWTAHMLKVRVFEAIDRRLLRRMDAVACVSEGQAAKVRRAGVKAGRLHVIHNSINISRFGNERSSSRRLVESLFATPRDFIALAVGRLSPEKGFDVFIDAARQVLAMHPGAGFAIIGAGPERALLEERVAAAGLGGQVVFPGFRNDVDQLVAGADVLVQTSYTEGLPNVVLEACAARIPVVATDVGGTREVITHGANGYLVQPGDPETIASHLLDLVQSPEKRTAMGARGRHIVETTFSFARQSARYTALFEQLVNRARTRANVRAPAASTSFAESR